MRRDTFLKSLAALAAAGALPQAAWANASIKMMIPANPGGGWDGTGRALGEALRDAGVASTVTFENKGGAAGAIGLAQFFNASKGDPNALMVMGAVMLGGIITGKPPVSLSQATPIARLTSEYNVFVLPASSPLKTSSTATSTVPPSRKRCSICASASPSLWPMATVGMEMYSVCCARWVFIWNLLRSCLFCVFADVGSAEMSPVCCQYFAGNLLKWHGAIDPAPCDGLFRHTENDRRRLILCHGVGAGFVARSFSGDKEQLVPLIKGALNHRGAALLDVISPCVAFNNHKGSTKSFDWVREHNEAVNRLDVILGRAPVTADYAAGTSTSVTLHDGGKLMLHKLDDGHDPRDPDAAIDPLSIPEVRTALQRTSFELLVGFQLTQEQLRYNATR